MDEEQRNALIAEIRARYQAAADAERLALVHLRETDRADALADAREIFPRAFLPDEGEATTL